MTHSQYEINWWRTSLGQEEIETITRAIQQEYISQGPITLELEQTLSRILNIPYVTTVTSGSVALYLALLASGIGPGNEVILPNYTFIATAHAVELTGAKAIFVDTQADLPIMDSKEIKNKINKNTRAIIPVHINGRCVHLNEIKHLCKEYQITLIEDAAQAIFSKSAAGYLGTQSDIGCYSMGMAKLLASGQGGILVTHDQKIDQRLKKLRNHGHIEIEHYSCSGLNFKYTDLLASVALEQIKKVPDRKQHLIEIYTLYAEALATIDGIDMIPVKIEEGELPIYAEVLCSNRQQLISYLAKNKIQARPFHISLNNHPHLNTSEVFPHALKWEQEGMILPCGPEQPLDKIKKVIQVLQNFKQT